MPGTPMPLHAGSLDASRSGVARVSCGRRADFLHPLRPQVGHPYFRKVFKLLLRIRLREQIHHTLDPEPFHKMFRE